MSFGISLNLMILGSLLLYLSNVMLFIYINVFEVNNLLFIAIEYV